MPSWNFLKRKKSAPPTVLEVAMPSNSSAQASPRYMSALSTPRLGSHKSSDSVESGGGPQPLPPPIDIPGRSSQTVTVVSPRAYPFKQEESFDNDATSGENALTRANTRKSFFGSAGLPPPPEKLPCRQGSTRRLLADEAPPVSNTSPPGEVARVLSHRYSMRPYPPPPGIVQGADSNATSENNSPSHAQRKSQSSTTLKTEFYHDVLSKSQDHMEGNNVQTSKASSAYTLLKVEQGHNSPNRGTPVEDGFEVSSGLCLSSRSARLENKLDDSTANKSMGQKLSNGTTSSLKDTEACSSPFLDALRGGGDTTKVNSDLSNGGTATPTGPLHRGRAGGPAQNISYSHPNHKESITTQAAEEEDVEEMQADLQALEKYPIVGAPTTNEYLPVRQPQWVSRFQQVNPGYTPIGQSYIPGHPHALGTIPQPRGISPNGGGMPRRTIPPVHSYAYHHPSQTVTNGYGAQQDTIVRPGGYMQYANDSVIPVMSNSFHLATNQLSHISVVSRVGGGCKLYKLTLKGDIGQLPVISLKNALFTYTQHPMEDMYLTKDGVVLENYMYGCDVDLQPGSVLTLALRHEVTEPDRVTQLPASTTHSYSMNSRPSLEYVSMASPQIDCGSSYVQSLSQANTRGRSLTAVSPHEFAMWSARDQASYLLQAKGDLDVQLQRMQMFHELWSRGMGRPAENNHSHSAEKRQVDRSGDRMRPTSSVQKTYLYAA